MQPRTTQFSQLPPSECWPKLLPPRSRAVAGKVATSSAVHPRKEGIFVGISAGGTFAGALKLAADAPEGATILCMLPDTGEPLSEHAVIHRYFVGHDPGGAEHLKVNAKLSALGLSDATPSPLQSVAVYVDDAIWDWRGLKWCHLLADDMNELLRLPHGLGQAHLVSMSAQSRGTAL